MNNLDPLAERVLGFFVAKKLLRVPGVAPCPNTKLYVEDVLRVAKEVAPRVVEVLPAALIRFPKTFLHKEVLPKDLQEVVRAIKRGEPNHPDIEGYRYRDMKRWADKLLPDSRSKPIALKKQMVTFRLSGETLDSVRTLSKRLGIPQAHVIEEAIARMRQS